MGFVLPVKFLMMMMMKKKRLVVPTSTNHHAEITPQIQRFKYIQINHEKKMREEERLE